MSDPRHVKLYEKMVEQKEEIDRLSHMANYYRHKCKVLGGALAMDGPVPSDFDLALLRQLYDLTLRGEVEDE